MPASSGYCSVGLQFMVVSYYPEDVGGKPLRNVGTYVSIYRASYPRRQYFCSRRLLDDAVSNYEGCTAFCLQYSWPISFSVLHSTASCVVC
jgi:hypothetical protein